MMIHKMQCNQFRHSANALLNRCVFSLDLNMATDLAHLIFMTGMSFSQAILYRDYSICVFKIKKSALFYFFLLMLDWVTWECRLA